MRRVHSKQITVAGEKIRVREHRDDERSALALALGPIVEHFLGLAKRKNASAPDMEAVFEKYVEQFARLAAVSCGKDQAWIDRLSEVDLVVLFATWWEVNSAFFVKSMLRRTGVLPPTSVDRSIN